MKKYIKLKSVSYRSYKPQDFSDVFGIFLVFQKENKISQYHSISGGHSESFYVRFLFHEFKSLVSRCGKNCYVGIDNETKKIFAFACFTENVLAKNSLDLQLTFKHPKYILNRQIIWLFVSLLHKIKNNRRILALLGNRAKFDKYVKLVKRIFKVKVIGKDDFNRYLVEFLP
jgi:hypothetical protein